GDGIYGNAGDNYNETWATVRVEDKTVPKIACKADITINCDRDTAITAYNFTNTWESVLGKVPSSMWPEVEGVCGNYELEFQDAGSLNTCNAGTITRTYRVKGFTSVRCTQRIIISTLQVQPILEHPISLHIWNSCTLTEEDVNANTVRLSPSVRGDVYGGCDKYDLNTPATTSTMTASQREGLTTNGFTPTGGALGISLQNQARFNSNYKNTGCTVFGKKLTIEEYTVGDGCRKWLVKWEYINWCDNTSAGCRETIYKYEDTSAPEITRAPGVDTDIKDETCSVDVVLRPSAVDSSLCPESSLSWVATIYPGVSKPGINEVPVRPVGETYSLTATGTGNNPSLLFRGLRAGIYGLRYRVTDGCGNVSEQDTVIGIWAKAPTPYCVSLSSAVMKNGLVELWASDFNRGSFTNCGNGVMLFTFNRRGQAEHPVVSRLHQEHYFKGFGVQATQSEYNAGNAQRWIPQINIRQRVAPLGPDTTVVGGSSGMQFGCAVGDRLDTALVVETRVWDVRSFRAGTTQGSDFCSTRLTLIDNQGGCGSGSLITINGMIENERAERMREVEVSLSAALPEYPSVTKTDKDGVYTFGDLPIGVSYEIKPSKTDNYLNGVNTLDLVKIQRHILGIERLESPYKMIAADADGDEAIRVNDIVRLRRLILGLDNELLGVPSWRFVDAGSKMDQGPWPFREVISHANLTETKVGNNFYGVKVGDVDGTAGANAVEKVTEPRSKGIMLSMEDRSLKAGEVVEVSLNASQFAEVYGMQLTLSHEGLALVSIDGRAIELSDEHVGKVRSNATTLSWVSAQPKTLVEGSEVMRLTFRATKAAKLSEALQITSEVTNAEAYTGADMERGSVSLNVRGRDELQFVLLQNEPNPWKTNTVIKYELPKAGLVKLTLMDITGRIIQVYDTKGEAGQNVLTITREQLGGASGVMIYQVESGSHTAQKKMLVIE
ncbi:MAG TPA: T9SS type A sorting domain-containing protein, partial [Saprospiraceae bacterium]|nr:T9SS type A sorting domain-containing protein [Saprospiraceae bacterium]